MADTPCADHTTHISHAHGDDPALWCPGRLADHGAGETTSGPGWDRRTSDLATAHADALDWAAAWDQRAFGTNEWPTIANLRRWAAEVRAGTRTIPPADRSQT